MIYGRRIGRRLKPAQKERLAQFLIETEVTQEAASLEKLGVLASSYDAVKMEIGFGTGDHLHKQAVQHPETLFIGCEPFLNGVAALQWKQQEEPTGNIRVFLEDALILLKALPDAFLDEIYLLFPDPWPKKRHQKRRFLQKETLRIMHEKLKKTGKILMATDHADYQEYIRELLSEMCDFQWKESKEFPEVWVPTRFQTKAELAGRSVSFFIAESL